MYVAVGTSEKGVVLSSFDSIVIGAGISGLLTAVGLERAGHKVALFTSDGLGGSCRPLSTPPTPHGLCDYGLKLFPYIADVSDIALGYVQNLLEIDLHPRVVCSQPMIYDRGHKPFVGFGDHPPAFASELSYYLNEKHLYTSLAPHQWVTELKHKFTGHYESNSIVTDIITEHQQVVQIIINDKKNVRADQYIYCGPPHLLPNLLKTAELIQKVKNRLARVHFWTTLSLDQILSESMSDIFAIQILRSSDFQNIWIGRFHPTAQDGSLKFQQAQWLSFVEAEDTDNESLIATHLKKLKKLVYRIYPEFESHLMSERIIVTPYSHGQFKGSTRSSKREILNLKNFWISTPLLAENPNLIGAILRSKQVVNEIIEKNRQTSFDRTALKPS